MNGKVYSQSAEHFKHFNFIIFVKQNIDFMLIRRLITKNDTNLINDINKNIDLIILCKF